MDRRWPCICVDFDSVSTFYLLEFGTVPTVWVFVLFCFCFCLFLFLDWFCWFCYFFFFLVFFHFIISKYILLIDTCIYDNV